MSTRFPDLIADALTRIDPQGCFARRDWAPLRRLVAKRAEEGDLPLDHPIELFGPWDAIGPTGQAALRRVVERDITGTMRWYPHGRLWNAAIRRCWELDRRLTETRRWPSLRRQTIGFANRLSAAPMNLRRRFTRASRRWSWRSGTSCTLDTLLAAVGKDPHWLCGDFVQGVRVDPRAAAFHVDPARQVVIGSHIGMDLMPTSEGMICLEANLQVGFLKRRRELQPSNPTGRGIIAAARDHGSTHILWMEGHRIPLQGWFMKTLGELGAPYGITTDFRQDPRMPTRRDLPSEEASDPERSSWLLRPPVGTLLVRRNEFTVGPDYVINDKVPFVRALVPLLNDPQRDSVVRVLPQTREPNIAEGSFESGHPNLVYKYPDGLSGTGVFFLRARTADDARRLARQIDARTGEAPGVFQRFVPPRLTPKGAVRDYRAEILVTPLGTWFLGAFRRVASQPMPREVPEGLVDASGALTSNMSSGGFLESCADEELAEVERAAVAVGTALRASLSQTFDDGLPRGAERSTGTFRTTDVASGAHAVGV